LIAASWALEFRVGRNGCALGSAFHTGGKGKCRRRGDYEGEARNTGSVVEFGGPLGGITPGSSPSEGPAARLERAHLEHGHAILVDLEDRGKLGAAQRCLGSCLHGDALQ